MCSILGAMFFPTEKKVRHRLWTVQRILAEAFAESKDRGKDAAGAAMIAEEYYSVVKGPWASDEFMLKEKKEPIKSSVLAEESVRPFEAFSQICREKEKELSLIMLHARAKTQGTEYENKNNHPIIVPDEDDKNAIIIGVHNGMVRNDTQIRKALRREKGLVTEAEVDSAAIFEVIHHALGKNEPTLDLMDEVAKWVEGQMAVCAVSRHHPHKVMFWRDGRPLEYVVAKDMGVVFFTSDDSFVKEAIARYNRGRILFKERLNLPGIEYETKIHTDDWSVIFDTSSVLGNGEKKYGIGEVAEERKTIKEIYDEVRAPTTYTSNNYTGAAGYQNTYKIKKEAAERYITTISNAVTTAAYRHKDSSIEDLSPSLADASPPEVDILDASEDASPHKRFVHGAAWPNSTDAEVVVEGEIIPITEVCSDDSPTTDMEDEIDPASADIYEAAQEALNRLKSGDSIIAMLEEVIQKCLATSQLGEYTDSLDATRDLYDTIFEESFAAGAMWRDKTSTSVNEDMTLQVMEKVRPTLNASQNNFLVNMLEKKLKAAEDNRDEIKRLLDKETSKKTKAQNYLFVLRLVLKVIFESVIDKTDKKAKSHIACEIDKALVKNGFKGNSGSGRSVSIVELIFSTSQQKTKGKGGTPPIKRIDAFLRGLEDRMSAKR